MKTSAAIVSLFLTINAVSAHTIFQELYVNGVSQGRLNGIRVPDYDGVCVLCFQVLPLIFHAFIIAYN